MVDSLFIFPKVTSNTQHIEVHEIYSGWPAYSRLTGVWYLSKNSHIVPRTRPYLHMYFCLFDIIAVGVLDCKARGIYLFISVRLKCCTTTMAQFILIMVRCKRF